MAVITDNRFYRYLRTVLGATDAQARALFVAAAKAGDIDALIKTRAGTKRAELFEGLLRPGSAARADFDEARALLGKGRLFNGDTPDPLAIPPR